MNLITIDNKILWSKNKKNLLLGNWCVNNLHRYQKKNKKKYLISEYHWTNKSKLRKDLNYLYKIYNLILDNLYINLNKFHNTTYPRRYWEILLHRWLWLYIYMLYDRWEIIKSIQKKNKNLSSKIFFYDLNKFIPEDSWEFTKSFIYSDDWNHWIYSEIFKFNKKIRCKIINKNKIKPKFLFKTEDYDSLNSLIKPYTFLSNAKQVYFQNTYFSKRFEIIYRLFNRQFFLNKKISLKNLDLNSNLLERKNFEKSSNIKDKFAKFAYNLLKYQLPKVYLEGYSPTQKLINKLSLPANPKYILTSIDTTYNDAFKMYAAAKVLKGSKLLIIQHGGSYGIADFNKYEEIEIKISDKFLTWGWNQKNSKVKPFFLQKTAYKKINKKKNTAGLILPITEFYLPPNQPLYFGAPGNKMDINKYIDNIVLFLNCINKNILNFSVIKSFENIKSKYILNSLKFKFPKLQYINPAKATYTVSKNYKLIVETVNSSNFLECLNLNIPIILINDQQYSSIRKSAVKEFQMLEKAQIVHNSPESAAKFVNENYSKLDEWWNSKSLKKIKNKFCDKFARRSKSPMTDFKKVLYK